MVRPAGYSGPVDCGIISGSFIRLRALQLRAIDPVNAQTLYDKIWASHVVREDARRHGAALHRPPSGARGDQPAGLRRTAARATASRGASSRSSRPPITTRRPATGIEGILDPVSRLQVETLDHNIREFGAKAYFPFGDGRQGIVHVIGPESGATLPGMTVVCGDSHTSTHGAFAALAFGIGTSEVEHVLATQCLVTKKTKSMRIEVEGTLGFGVTAKDIILAIIGRIGTAGGTGYTIEYAGSAIRALSMEGRMTICNMSIEAGARAGMVAVDDTTIEYVRGRPFAPQGRSLGPGGGLLAHARRAIRARGSTRR